MNSSGKYAFIFLGFALLMAGVVMLMEQITEQGEPSYWGPCSLIGLGFGLGVLAWNFSSGAAGSTECRADDASSEDQGGVSSAFIDSGVE